MTLLDLAQQRVPMRQVGSEWHGPCPACGTSQRDPRMSDRFTVKPDKGIFFCRTCTPEGGDAVAFLRKFENKSCPEAHALLGKACDSATCPVREKCSQGKKSTVAPGPRQLRPPKPVAAPAFVPAEATAPADLWRQRAEKLITEAHAALLACPEQLGYLARRGLPREAIERDRLGWLAEDLYRPCSAWGLPEVINEATSKPKKLWLPQGILIPFFDAAGNPDRIRIRRHKVKEGEARYYWVPGSGDDVPVLGREARAFVVVESDLDAFLVRWHAGDLVGAIPLGTCSAKPKESAMAALRQALTILVALDGDAAGARACRWWAEQFPRAKRWPVPAGKDPGEYFQDHGGNIRAWVLAGLPPVFSVAATAPAPIADAAAATAAPSEISTPDAPGLAVIPGLRGGYLVGESQRGVPYLVAEQADDLPELRSRFPEAAPFLRDELPLLKGMDADSLDQILRDRLSACTVFPEGIIRGCRPIVGDGSLRNVAVFDPSRARAARARR